MYLSMNGPAGPEFPLPTWVIVDESALWLQGMPNAIPTLNNPTVCNGKSCLAIFASQEDALSFLAKAGMIGVRPLAITGLVVFIAILKNRIDSGVKHVVRYSPDLPAADFWECDADKLLQRLSDAARDG